jgi:DNA/RNA-binding domain of Phe-tRNA-synthetase-like protein
MRKIVVSDDIFKMFPDFKRGIIIVKDIDNRLINNNIQQILDKEIEKRAGQNCTEHNFIRTWDNTHILFGSNPNKYPPSIKSLLKRIQKGGGFPFVNSVVALFNYISIKYLIPCGGDDITKINGNLCLGFASGNEKFVPLGGGEPESPIRGEVIYYDDLSLNVMCRRWNWRNGDFTKIMDSSKQIVINIDGVGIVSKEIIEEARDELVTLLVDNCNATLKSDFIDKENKEIDVDL